MPKDEELKKPSIELILYRMGEMSGKIDTVGVKLDNYQTETNDKISKINVDLAVATALSKREEEDHKEQPKWDVQKIVTTSLALVASSLLVIQQLTK